MSLINDALKKAQRQRTGDSPLSQAPMPGGSSARPKNGSPFNPQLLLLGAGAIIGLLIATGAVLFMRDKPAAENRGAPPPRIAAAPVAQPVEKAPPNDAKPSPDNAPLSANAPAASPAKPDEPLPVVKTEAAPAATAPTIVAPVVAAPAPKPATPSLRMIEAVEALRVAGIRASATDAKVLMNDRVYRVGDTVDHALGIKLTGVTASSLTFQDGSGAVYTRNF